MKIIWLRTKNGIKGINLNNVSFINNKQKTLVFYFLNKSYVIVEKEHISHSVMMTLGLAY